VDHKRTITTQDPKLIFVTIYQTKALLEEIVMDDEEEEQQMNQYIAK